MGRIPAFRQSATASFASGRGGSIIRSTHKRSGPFPSWHDRLAATEDLYTQRPTHAAPGAPSLRSAPRLTGWCNGPSGYPAPLWRPPVFPIPNFMYSGHHLALGGKGDLQNRGYSASSSVFETGVACTSAASVGSPCTAPPETVQLLHSTANFKRFWPSAESIRSFPEAVASSTTVIRFCVKVPSCQSR